MTDQQMIDLINAIDYVAEQSISNQTGSNGWTIAESLESIAFSLNQLVELQENKAKVVA